jgi:Endonuclease/Exonuclease/phosphatase family
MTADMRIANWNLKRAATKPRRDAIASTMAEIDSDIWVITETNDRITPADGFHLVAQTGNRVPEREGERWVSIWSRFEGEQRETRDAEYAACAVIPQSGRSLAIYGTVLPWRGSAWGKYPSTDATAYGAAMAAQSADWKQLAKSNDLCVAGDFNQDLSDLHYYWSRAARQHLRAALERCNLSAVTGGDADPVRRLTKGAEACIDHICLSPALKPRLTGEAVAWRPLVGGRHISDHPGVHIDLAD